MIKLISKRAIKAGRNLLPKLFIFHFTVKKVLNLYMV